MATPTQNLNTVNFQVLILAHVCQKTINKYNTYNKSIII